MKGWPARRLISTSDRSITAALPACTSVPHFPRGPLPSPVTFLADAVLSTVITCIKNKFVLYNISVFVECNFGLKVQIKAGSGVCRGTFHVKMDMALSM